MSNTSSPVTSCSLLDLGTDILPRVILSCSHVDWARLAPVCRALRAHVAHARAACSHAEPSTLQLTLPILYRPLGQGVLSCVLGLQSLVLSGQAGIDDAQLQSLTVLQQLNSLDVAATDITSRGLRSLHSLQRLAELDITFCPIVSYAAVLDLRQHCPNLKLIRRQPKWLDGHFETPWGEVHSYYPCGAFSFSRDVESKGWVAQLKNCGEYLEDRLIFVDQHRQQPNDFTYNGRIGVLLKRLHSCHGEQHQVLVLQSLDNYEPPSTWPPLRLQPAPGRTINDDDAGVMVSTMVVRPLEPGCTEPPADLQARLRLFCDERNRSPAGGSCSLVRREAEISAMISMHQRAPEIPDFELPDDLVVMRVVDALVSPPFTIAVLNALVDDPLLGENGV